MQFTASVWLSIVASLNLNLHYEFTLKFQTEIKDEIDFWYYIYYTNSIDLILSCIMNLISDKINDFQ